MSRQDDIPPQKIALPAASELPGLGIRPADLIEHSAWSEARDRIIALLNAGLGPIALLGPPGTGKTALLQYLATMFRERGRAVCLLHSGDSSVDLGPAEIVLVDEADRISDTRLDEYRSRSDIAVICAALPASAKRFEKYPDISVVHLPRLSSEEACKFVAARLAQLGLPKGCLTEAAWTQLIAHGRGVPRLLVGILGFALFLARIDSATCVTGSHVEEAVDARGGSSGEVIAAEPVSEQLDFAEERAPAVVPRTKGSSTDTALDVTAWPPPAAGRMPSGLVVGLYLTAIVAMYAAPIAAWLTWSTHRHAGGTSTLNLRAPAMVVAQMSQPLPAGTEQLMAVPGTAAGSAFPTARPRSAERDTAGADGLAGSTSLAPTVIAKLPDNAAPGNTTPQNEALTAATGATTNPPSGELPPAISRAPAEHVGDLALPPPEPVWSENAPSASARGATSAGDASVADQRDASAGIPEHSTLDARSERRTQDASTTVPEWHRAQSQTKELSDRFAQTTLHVAMAQTAQRPNREVPAAGHQALEPTRVPRVAFTRRPTVVHMSLPVQQLLSARRALVENHSSVARGLLEAAQTTIVFEADVAPERSGAAAGQIADALSLLNAGSTVGALPHLNRAIIAIQPTS